MSEHREKFFKMLIERTGLKRAPRLRKPKKPLALERAYLTDLHRVTGAIKNLVNTQFIPKLAHFQNQAGIRHDAWTDDLYDDVKELSIKFARQYTDAELKAIAMKTGKSVDKFNRDNLNDSLGKVLGIDLFGSEPFLDETLSLFALNNVNLIKTIPDRFFGELGQEVYSGFQAGDRWEDIAKGITDRYGVMDWNAERIARDQVGKLNGTLNQQRQEDVGVDEYTWLGVGDERERESHVANNDKTFRWDDPPVETGNPGEDIMCRCTAIPNLDKFFE